MRRTIKIEGMGCDHCVAAVRAALESVDGVQVEEVEIGQATVDASADVSGSDIESAIREAGYEPVSTAEA